jgi:ribonuclease HI
MSQKIVEKFGCEYFAFTDGSCWNFDPLRFYCGGSAYVIINNHAHVVKSMHKGFIKTTSNRMEMLAIISAIVSIPEGSSIVVFTDSKYCIEAFSEDYPARKNIDLIALFGKYRQRLKKVLLCHVKGHVGIPLNEWCDYWSNFEYKAMYKKCKEFASKSNSL